MLGAQRLSTIVREAYTAPVELVHSHSRLIAELAPQVHTVLLAAGRVSDLPVRVNTERSYGRRRYTSSTLRRRRLEQSGLNADVTVGVVRVVRRVTEVVPL